MDLITAKCKMSWRKSILEDGLILDSKAKRASSHFSILERRLHETSLFRIGSTVRPVQLPLQNDEKYSAFRSRLISNHLPDFSWG